MKTTKRTAVWLDDESLRWLDQMAERPPRSNRSAILRMVIAQAIRRESTTQPPKPELTV